MEETNKKSTIDTSRKVYVFKLGMIHVEVITFLYTVCRIAKVDVNVDLFLAAIAAAAIIIATLNLADGMKKGE
jgi:hypothetical protein